jgi:hypothetical protein
MSRLLKKIASFLAKAVMRRLQSRAVRGRAPALIPVVRMRRRRDWR